MEHNECRFVHLFTARLLQLRHSCEIAASHLASEPGFTRAAVLVANCPNEVHVYFDGAGEEHYLPRYQCGVRTCPACEGRYYRTFKKRISQFKRYLTATDNDNYHLVLTVKNPALDDLAETLDGMHSGFKRLVRLYPKADYLRVTQITRAANGSPHPHLHAVISFPRSSGGQSLHEGLIQEQWQHVLKLDYTPEVKLIRMQNQKHLEGCSKYLQSAPLPFGRDIEAVKDRRFFLSIAKATAGMRLISSTQGEKDGKGMDKVVSLPIASKSLPVARAIWNGESYYRAAA